MTFALNYRFTSVVLALLMMLCSIYAADSETLSDSAAHSDPNSLSLVLTEEMLADLDYKEFADWISILPGIYPLDLGGYYQPYRAQYLGLNPWVLDFVFRGRKMEDHLLGSPESQWIPPGAVRRLQFDPFSISAMGAVVKASLKTLNPEPPSSRIAVRDGYYGTGFVDFDLAENIAPSWTLNGGGRVSNSDGRVENSAAYGLNLRAEVVWWDSAFAGTDSSGLWGWWGIMQNRRKTGVPYQNYDHNTFRYESDGVVHWRNHTFRIYGVQQRETYHYLEDAWDELGVILKSKLERSSYGAAVQIRGSAAVWRLGNTNRSTTSFGGGDLTVHWKYNDHFRIASLLGVDLSDDYDAAPRLSLRTVGRIAFQTSIFAGLSQRQRQPDRFQSSADFNPDEHYLPYDPAFYQYPDLHVQGNPDLQNETLRSAFAGCRFNYSWLSGECAYIIYRMENPISWRVLNNQLEAFNASADKASGALGWFSFKPGTFLEIGGTGSYLPLKTGTRRLFPEVIGHPWMQFRRLFANNHLDMRLRFWGDFWGQRWFPVENGWEKIPNDFILSGRISARLYGFQIYWGVNNILDRVYALLPDHLMMHKEEVWGIAWNFRN